MVGANGFNSVATPNPYSSVCAGKLDLVAFPPGYRYVILDIPLLFETKKLLKYMKHTVVVYW